ncbi:MAG: RluA family pseudouridine synthase [Saprospiraceae bacterium]|nr:RluA family pseudouridine synthase [Saprospiraceae bacterium]
MKDQIEDTSWQEPSDDLIEVVEITTDTKQSPVRLDKFLMDRIQKISRNKIQKSIEIGAITVDGKSVKSNHKVKPHQHIRVVLPASPYDNSRVIPENIPLNILYEDDEVLIINKPANMVVHPGFGNFKGTLLNALAFHLGGGDLDADVHPGLVHRIDKDTTGIMIVAKTEEAMTHLAKQFYDHTIEREYQALVWGDLPDDKGRVEGHIGRHPRDRMQFFVYPEGDQGKHAVTHYEVIERMYYVTLVKCKLETGRTHQIRVHMKYIGHTLFGDIRYGGNQILKGTIFSKYRQFVENCLEMMPRQSLHAKSLGFIHPKTEQRMYFESPLPEDFSNVLEKWRNYTQSRKALLEDNQ